MPSGSEKRFFIKTWFGGDHALEKALKYSQNQSALKSSPKLDNHFVNFSPPWLETKTPFSKDPKVNYLQRSLLHGWHGQSLNSKTIIKFQNLFKELKNHILNKVLIEHRSFNRNLKKAIFEEFCEFSKHEYSSQNIFSSLEDFWNCFENKKNHKIINQFFSVYCGRIATIHFLKIKFIAKLWDNPDRIEKKKIILNPSAFIEKIFQHGSLYQIKSSAFESLSFYNWYLPNNQSVPVLIEMSDLTEQLSINEILRSIHCIVTTQKQKTHFFHALSHANFGLFLNSLIINFPIWRRGKSYIEENLKTKDLHLNCLYKGDHLNSLFLSHWLAQESIFHDSHKVINSHIDPSSTSSGQYLCLLNEIQFITSLFDIAKSSNIEPRKFISYITQSRDKKLYANHSTQSHLSGLSVRPKKQYDRIVLNLVQSLSKNPHFSLLSHISNNLNLINSTGNLIVMSNQNLFVPSLSQKTNNLMKQAKLEAIFDFSKIMGKGEIPHYIYIFTKHQVINKNDNEQTFCHFRFDGELLSFQEFCHFTHGLESFFRETQEKSITMFENEITKGFSLEFYQDCIKEGRLVMSLQNDGQSNITHPNFFKKLVKQTFPFGNIFHIVPLETKDDFFSHKDSDKNDRDDSESLGQEFFKKTNPNYVLIVDQRIKDKTSLEIVSYQSYRAKAFEYGIIHCHYFGLTPKSHTIHFNILREYLLSPIGCQIASITFANKSRIKSSLECFLLPQFILEDIQEIPFNCGCVLKKENILEKNIKDIEEDLKKVIQSAEEKTNAHPRRMISYLAQMKYTITNRIKDITEIKDNKRIQFTDPFIQQQLAKIKNLIPVFPYHPNITIKFHEPDPDDIFVIDRIIQGEPKEIEDQKILEIEFFSGDRKIASTYSPIFFGQFLYFILKNIPEKLPIQTLFSCLKAPLMDDFNKIIYLLEERKSLLSQSYVTAEKLFFTAIQKAIVQEH